MTDREIVVAEYVHQQVQIGDDWIEVLIMMQLIDGETDNTHRQHPLNAPDEQHAYTAYIEIYRTPIYLYRYIGSVSGTLQVLALATHRDLAQSIPADTVSGIGGVKKRLFGCEHDV